MAAEPITKKWSRREVLGLFASPLEAGEENLAFTKLKVAKTTFWDAKTPHAGPARNPDARRHPGQLESTITVEFFNENTHVRSGAKTLTRRMAMTKDEMYCMYRAQFPNLVRRAAERSHADRTLHGPLDQFLLSRLEVANRMSSAPGWSEVGELARRREWYIARLETMRTERAAGGKNTSLQDIAVKVDPDSIHARSETTFWRIIKRCGVRFVTATPNHNCEIHKNAEVDKRTLQTEQDALKEMEAELEQARVRVRDVLDEDSVAKARADVARLEPLILPARQSITRWPSSTSKESSTT